MGLYGVKETKPGRIDHNAPETLKVIEDEQGSVENLREAAVAQIEKEMPVHQKHLRGINMSTNQKKRPPSAGKVKAAGTQVDSDEEQPIPDRSLALPITIDNQCLAHQTNSHDLQLTMRMFKMACLAYKPSDVEYRN